MVVDVIFELKSNIVSWSNQVYSTKMSDKMEIDICIDKTKCRVKISHEILETAKEYLYLVWELLTWYDGYFYKPIEYLINGREQDTKSLTPLNMYITDKKWISSALLIGRNHRSFSEDIILNYKNLRNKDRSDKSMNRSMINSYFFLISDAYKDINIEHRLVLLMHICDGFAREFLNGDNKNNAGNISIIVRQIGTKKYKQGVGLLNVDEDKAVNALGNTRNELTHYKYEADKPSLGSYISNSDYETDNMVNLYAFYVLELALRVSLLETVGYCVDDNIKEYLLDENLDWIKLEKHLEENCVIPMNLFRQIMQRLSNNTNDVSK